MSRYGDIGRPVLLLEAYKDWADERRGSDLEEAQTKADFPEFLYGSVSQSMYKGYTKVMPQYARYTAKENLQNFQPHRVRGLNGIRGIGYVGDAGEYPELRRSERPSASLVIDTYGGVYSVTRQATINDDSGHLLKDNPEDMGYEAGLFVNETIMAFIESNPTAPDGDTVYHANHNNAVTAALDETALAAAISAMENQTDEDGRQIRVTPETLAVKNVVLELIANRIIRSQQTGTTINDSTSVDFDKGTDNPLAGILPANAVVRDPYWSDANDWYLFASPRQVPAFAAGFLNGKEEPSVFLKNPEARGALGGGGQDPYTWEWDSVDFKVRLDFGVGVVDHRGTYRSIVT
jgi:hypothetical protein